MSAVRDEIRIEYMPLAKVLAAPRNPKGHDIDLIRQSFQRFDFVEPLVLNETTGRLVAGHGGSSLFFVVWRSPRMRKSP